MYKTNIWSFPTSTYAIIISRGVGKIFERGVTWICTNIYWQLAASRGWVWEVDVPPPAQSAEALTHFWAKLMDSDQLDQGPCLWQKCMHNYTVVMDLTRSHTTSHSTLVSRT